MAPPLPFYAADVSLAPFPCPTPPPSYPSDFIQEVVGEPVYAAGNSLGGFLAILVGV